MMTGEKWCDDPKFRGNGTSVIIVTHTNCCPDPFEFYICGVGLDCYSGPFNMQAYFWDKRDPKEAREYYERVFEIGTIWRISGAIECEKDSIVFIDPVYMPYSGEYCASLRAHVARASAETATTN